MGEYGNTGIWCTSNSSPLPVLLLHPKVGDQAIYFLARMKQKANSMNYWCRCQQNYIQIFWIALEVRVEDRHIVRMYFIPLPRLVITGKRISFKITKAMATRNPDNLLSFGNMWLYKYGKDPLPKGDLCIIMSVEIEDLCRRLSFCNIYPFHRLVYSLHIYI